MPIEYNMSLTPRARELRTSQTPAEKIFWHAVRNRKVLGYKIVRQKPITSYIADFYCNELELVIEIDGDIHQSRKAYDAARTDDLKVMGLTVIRYSNDQIQTELPRVLVHLKKVLNLLSKLPSRQGVSV